MKKTIFLGLLFICGIAIPAFSNNLADPLPVKEIKVQGYTSVVVNASVTVYLVNIESDIVKMSGEDLFMQHVTVKVEGNKLIIDASKNKDFKKKGAIYIPAALIHGLEVNSAAVVRSGTSLDIPLLNVIINGSCKVSIVNKGEVKLTGSLGYDFDYYVKRRYPLINEEQ